MNPGFMEKVMTKVDLTGSQPKSEKRLTKCGLSQSAGLRAAMLASSIFPS